jgi:hypothetical protein
MARQSIDLTTDQSSAQLELKVFRGIWIEGTVKDAKTGETILGRVDYLALQSNPNTPNRFGLQDDWEIGRFPMEQQGKYRVAGLPGPGVLLARSYRNDVYPLSVGADKIEGYNKENDRLPTTPVGLPLSNWNIVEYIDPEVGSTEYQRDLTMEAAPSVTGHVVGIDGLPATKLAGIGLRDQQRDHFFSDLKGSEFTVLNYDPDLTRDLFFKTLDSQFVAHCRLTGVPPKDVEVRLQPSITVTGRLIETETDKPAVGYSVYTETSKLGKFRLNDTETDSRGRFEIKGLLAGNTYDISTSNPQHFSSGKNDFTIDLTNAKPGDVIELGDVTGKNAVQRTQ